MLKTIFLAVSGALLANFASAEALYNVPGEFRLEHANGQSSLSFTNEDGFEIARYDLSGCRFCDGTSPDCKGDGVFSLLLPGSEEPMVAAVCHPVNGGQRFSVYAPQRNRQGPILAITGDSYVKYAAHPDRLVIERDRDRRRETEIWNAAVKIDKAEADSIRQLITTAGKRTIRRRRIGRNAVERELNTTMTRIAETRNAEALVAMAAPDVLLSFGGTRGVGELRKMIQQPWFWSEFAHAIAGGGGLVRGVEGGRYVRFPAVFNDWPNNLDVFGHLFGDQPDAVLRAGPSDKSPVLAPIFGRILSRGPRLVGWKDLVADGWINLCLAEVGCGFARSHDARSPVGWRAVMFQERRGEPWVLKTFVAGD